MVERVARGYSLRSTRTGEPVARLKPTGEDDKVQVLWWNGQRWGASGPFGIATMPLDKALAYIANEPDFWIHAR
jgi:antitoxin (DNA-binding transcriptional repressor) of toxin-antitoxin stability system